MKVFPGVSVIKNPSATVGDGGLIPGWGRSHSSILAWRLPWTERLGGPQSVGFLTKQQQSSVGRVAVFLSKWSSVRATYLRKTSRLMSSFRYVMLSW